MCDYSLMGVPNRLAKEGEELVLYRFHTGTLGFTSVVENSASQPSGSFWRRLRRSSVLPVGPLTAVCVPPGARVRLEEIPKSYQVRLEVGETEEVTFTQLSLEPHMHRDAVRFDTGKISKLQDLRPGMRAKVLDLSLTGAIEREIDEFLEFSEVRHLGY